MKESSPEDRHGSAKRVDWVTITIATLLTLISVTTLYHCNPATNGFYPRCPLFALSGWQCAGCGGLRALHALLHGHLKEAWHYNQLLVVSLPLWPLLLARPRILANTNIVGALLMVLILFTILRNFLHTN